MLVVVAPNEKKVRIEVGYGLEGVLTDAISSQIISSVMIPEFKNGKMSEGVKEGVFAFIFAVFFLILKDVFKRNSQATLCQWALDEVVQAQIEVVVAQVVEESALAEAELAADCKIYQI